MRIILIRPNAIVKNEDGSLGYYDLFITDICESKLSREYESL